MTVSLVIVSHSVQLASGVAELAGQMTQGKTSIFAAGGTIDDTLGTSFDKILAALQSADNPDGVLILLDLGSAILSTDMALEFLDDEQRSRIHLTSAPLIEGAIAAAVEASLGHTLQQVQQAAEKASNPAQLRLLKPLTPTEEETPLEPTPNVGARFIAPATPGNQPTPNVDTQIAPTPPATQFTPPQETQLLLTNPAGLHARPASLFVQTAAKFQANIQALSHGRQADAASIMEVLSLGARQGDTLTLRATGPEAAAALQALTELVKANFYETTPENPAPANSNTTSETGEGVGTPFMPSPRGGGASPNHTSIASPSTSTPGEPWHAITTSPGVALGPAFLYTSSNLSLKNIEPHTISQEQIAPEQERLRHALDNAAQELRTLSTNLQTTVGQAQAAIFDAQALMLQDPTLQKSALQMIEQSHIDAAAALAAVGENQANILENLDDPLLAARAIDMRDAVTRAIQLLTNTPNVGTRLIASGGMGDPWTTLNHPVIILAHDLTPSDTALLRPDTVLGICTVQGGPTAHSAILARALGIPAISGLNEAALQIIHSGDELGLDAGNGLLYQHPTPEIRADLEQRIAQRQARLTALRTAAQQTQAPILIDNRRILLLANVGSEAEAEAARQWGAQGIGLLRTEFLFASAPTLPNEDEQRTRYAQVFRAFAGPTPDQAGPIVVRTLDAGADKPMPALNAILGPIIEVNPALGLRGIRIHLVHQILLEQQLRALLQAASETGIELHIMFPMITTVEELHTARSIFDRVYQDLKNQGIALPAHVPVGIMVEVPAAAVMAPELAELADFFSIGANDLLQYTLATDRTNPTLTGLYHPMQPAVLRLIHQVANAGRRAGKPVAVCGEIAGNPQLAPTLVALGVDELSMVPTAIPSVRTALTQKSPQELSQLADKITRSKTVSDVEQASTNLEKT